MARRIIFAVASLFVLLAAIGPVKTNPVYPGELTMTIEDIVITISKVDGKTWAEVNGTYTFSVIAQSSPHPAVMYYPVPPDAEAVSVKIGQTPLDWTSNGTYYTTFVGDFQFIKWLIPLVPDNFQIKTCYEHPIHEIDGNYTFLYALGTGRYLAEPKSCLANVTAYIDKYFATAEGIGVCLVTQEGIMEPANHTITLVDAMWKVTYAEYVAFAGAQDFMLAIMAEMNPDINADGIVDIYDAILLAQSYGSTPSDADWNASADLNNDNTVDILDAIILAGNFGKTA